MSKVNDGGAAYPREWTNHKGDLASDGGMTLRDWFAGQATEEDIRAHIAIMGLHEGALVEHNTGRCRSREQAKYAYADAMLAAREAR